MTYMSRIDPPEPRPERDERASFAALAFAALCRFKSVYRALFDLDDEEAHALTAMLDHAFDLGLTSASLEPSVTTVIEEGEAALMIFRFDEFSGSEVAVVRHPSEQFIVDFSFGFNGSSRPFMEAMSRCLPLQ